MRDARALTGFSAIEAAGAEQVEIAVGGAASVEVEVDDNLVGNITTRVEDGVLKIGSKGSFSTTRAPVVRITLPSLTAVSMSGSGDAEIRGLSGGELTLNSRGSGRFSTPSGHLDKVSLNLMGSGDSDLTKLSVTNFVVSLNGSGTARIRASEAISARVNGSGTVYYGGDARTVEVRVNGTGSVKRID